MPGKSIVPIPSQALQPSVAKDALPKGVLLSATAQVLTHLRGGINPTVAQQVQQIEDDLRAQGQQSLLGDAAWSQIEDTVFDITPKKQSWSDWLWEKTISKTAKTLGQEWPSQREIEEQIAESFKQQVEEPDAVLERATQDDKGKKNTDADITTTHDRQRRAVPIVINPIPDQEIGCLDRFDLTINPTEVFYDADGDHLELNATLSDGSPLPDFFDIWKEKISLPLLSYYQNSGTLVQVLNNIAYVAAGIHDLQLLDVTDPTVPRLLGSYDSNQPRYGGYVNGNNGGYINGHVSSLQVIDATAYIAYAVNPSDDFYAVAADLLILDVANPATPTLLGSYDLKYRRNGIDLREAIAVQTIGTTAYVLDQYGDLQMFDVTNPAVPFSFSLYYRTGRNMDRDEVRGMYISNDVAYVADGFSGLYMVNVSRPSAPSLRGSYSLPSNSNDVCGIQVINNIAYVADGSYGVWILDVSNLSDLIVLSAYTTPDGTYNAPAQALMVQVINNIAYVADYGGLLVLNVTNPAEPTLFGRGALSSALGLQVVDQVAYVVGDGLQIVQLPISITQDYEYILSFAPDNYFEQPLDIRITASDGRGGEATDEFRLTMESCNYDDGVTALIIAISALIGGLAASYFCFSFCFSHITAMMDSRKDHPFADELQKCLRLADVSDFRSPHGRAYLEVVEKLLRAFETRGINIKSMMIAEQKQVAVDVAEAIRSLISSRIGFFGCSKSDITLSAIRQIVGTVADRVRDKRMGHARQEEAQERELGVVLAR